MKEQLNDSKGPANRRSFIKKGLAAAGTASVAGGLLANGLTLFGHGVRCAAPKITFQDFGCSREPKHGRVSLRDRAAIFLRAFLLGVLDLNLSLRQIPRHGFYVNR
jgi:hypothetical protein